MEKNINLDSFLPAEMAHKAELVGVKKANSSAITLFFLAVLAGAFIALGAIFSTTVVSGTSSLPYGVTRLLAGITFSLGLILVVVGGAELFTGNNLIIMAWASKRISTKAVLRNWGIVYLGNFVGSILTALLMVFSRQHTFGSGAVGEVALKIAAAKVNLGFVQAIALGILCNALVCLAVWLTFSARTTMDKILAIVFPITAFVAAGFEHSIANMYFISYGMFIKIFDPQYVAGLANPINLDGLTWQNFFLKNLLPVTIGNIIGGAVLVGAVYWLIYLAKEKTEEAKTAEVETTDSALPLSDPIVTRR